VRSPAEAGYEEINKDRDPSPKRSGKRKAPAEAGNEGLHIFKATFDAA
jgi:hypothetical protein